MIDRDNVIKGLDYCDGDGCCREPMCPYFHKRHCVEELMRDAFELLKAQQPRVLTLEEVKASKGKDLILEYILLGCEDSIVTPVTIEGCGSRGVSFALSVACEYTAYNRNHSLGWRCWSARPTDEQRKAVSWDD